MKVTAMFQNDTDISSSTNEQQTISIAINAVLKMMVMVDLPQH